jgi:hypothetical protein
MPPGAVEGVFGLPFGMGDLRGHPSKLITTAA